MENFDDAILAPQAAIALSPADFPGSRIQLAALYSRPGANPDRLDDAERLLREAYSPMPESKNLLSLLEHVLRRQGKSDEARKRLERWFDLDNIYRMRVAKPAHPDRQSEP